jgi:LacI family transcriptional regulator
LTATIKDVARVAQVSIKTVSRVINNEPHVTEDMRTRVQDAIDQLGYAPNISARRLVQQRSYMLCILLHTSGFYQSALINKVLEVGYEYDYDILIQTYFPSQTRSKNKLSGLINERRIDGLITTPPCDTDELVLELVKKSRIPLVQISPYSPSPEVPSIAGDDRQGAFQMTNHLIELGHRAIAFLKGPRNHRTSQERLAGFHDALNLAQMVIDPQLELDSEFNFEGGYTAAKIAMSTQKPPTAIFGGNDEAAFGAIYALQEMGYSVPQQVSVCGFDDVLNSKNVWPGLTTVHHPVDEIADRALSMLVALLKGEAWDHEEKVIPSRLVIRGSTAQAIQPGQ